ncbi:hypothetical protein GCM10023116_20140 [Kistimonas scapharcae]|uniref:Uncharacterized protein n=2 Tax=Kistimonas scapharcae TaxID=1036133 RepID=A0ABP8V162_9GAMM
MAMATAMPPESETSYDQGTAATATPLEHSLRISESHASALKKDVVSSPITTKASSEQIYQRTPSTDFTHRFSPQGGWIPDKHSQIQAFCRGIRKHRKRCDLDQEKDWIQKWLEPGKPWYGRICEEAACYYIRQVSLPTKYRLLEDDSAANKRQLLQLAGDRLAQALACYLQETIKQNMSYDDLEILIVKHYSARPDHKYNTQFNKRIRSVCSIYGHIQERLSATSQGKRQHSHDDSSHRFYQLKRIADPSYTPPRPPIVPPKLTFTPHVRY